MSDVKFSELLTASYLSRNDYIVILRSGSATQPDQDQAPPNNYTVQAKFFTASYATHSISSSHALTASYIKFSDINAGVGVFTLLSSGVVIGTNITASNITASGYVSASVMRAAISMSSPIGIFTNITASNITASGYVSASAMSSSLFHGTASYSITSLYPPALLEDAHLAVSFSSPQNTNSGKYTIDSGYEYFWTKNNKIGKIGYQKTNGFLTNVNLVKSTNSPSVNFSDGFMISGSSGRSMLDTSNKNIIKLCSTNLNLYVLFDDGTLIGWGSGSSGQLGQGAVVTIPTYLSSSAPAALGTAPWVMISGQGSLSGKTVIDVDTFAAGLSTTDSSSLLILTSTASGNNLHVCGRNGYGQLGYGTIDPQHIPFQVEYIYENSVSVANITMSKIFAGSVTSHVISHANQGSKLYSAGRDKYLALGIGGLVETNQTYFLKTADNVRTIILGQNHENLFQSFIIKNDNTVFAAGRNERGQLGYTPSDTSSSTYTQINGLSADSISVHFQSSTTMNSDFYTYTSIYGGDIKSWGYNIHSLIGDNTAVNKSTPTTPVGGAAAELQNVVKVAPGWSKGDVFPSNYILTSNGSVYSTGNATNRSVRGLNQSILNTTELATYQKLIFNVESNEKVVDISTGTRSETYAALYLLTNMGNILVVGSNYANGQPEGCDSYMPKYVYRNGQFVSYLSTA